MTDAVEERKIITLVEPPGHRRAHMVFANGRYLIVDMQLGDLVDAVDAFLDDEAQRFLELPIIDTVENIVLRNPCLFSRKAMEQLQSMSVSWVKATPGDSESVLTHRATDARVAELRGSIPAAKVLNVDRLKRH
jgi:hypothetical protein